MVDILKWLASFIPRDPNNSGGFGPFRLPKSAQWMNAIFIHHDRYYDIGPDAGMTLSEIDWRVFKALTILAEQAPNTMERCHRAKDICKYWPIMRSAGHYLYDRRAVKRIRAGKSAVRNPPAPPGTAFEILSPRLPGIDD